MYHLEDILEVYTRPYDPQRPQVCLDEASKQLLKDKRAPLPLRPGKPGYTDSEYEREGVCQIFVASEPLAGRRYVQVRERRTKQDWGDAVSQLVARFNREGLAAVVPQHGGGPGAVYSEAECERILAEVRRPPDRDLDRTTTWSLMTLRRALRRTPDGLPKVSTFTIWGVLHEAGWSWQRSRTWCQTGRVLRKRMRGIVEVRDPDATPKKS